ncbi:hypothetical protein NL676_015702 [Syzygium grande]|nr:hypothetical protein NL676_015702 [Syzygium grande]
MIDLARLFASHGVRSTIVATPNNALSFQRSIARDQDSGRPISILPLELPPGCEPRYSDMSAAPFTDTSMLQEPLRLLLIARPPDCIIVDMFHRWSADVIDEVGVPRIMFHGNGCFSRSVYPVKYRKLDKYTGKQYLRTAGLEASGYPYIWAHGKTLEMVQCEYDPFEIPGLPDRIGMTWSQLPHFHKHPGGGKPHGRMWNSEERSLGVMANSFLELEPAYVEYFKKEMAKKAWVVGPVSLCNRNVEDNAERGQRAATDEHSCLSWLTPKQLLEIGYGLEASSFSFIWAAGEILELLENGEGGRDDWLPSGFEERWTESKRGLIIRGWAPQLLILEHPSVGGFMTHRG